MGTSVAIRYDGSTLQHQLPAGADVLNIRELAVTASRQTFSADLVAALASHFLGDGRVAVVVADEIRLCGYDRFLLVLRDRLQAHGAGPADLAFYIASSNYDCTDASLFRDLGLTARGTPIRIRKDILAADFVITFGAISNHHYFAGYGGGGQTDFPRPGISGSHLPQPRIVP